MKRKSFSNWLFIALCIPIASNAAAPEPVIKKPNFLIASYHVTKNNLDNFVKYVSDSIGQTFNVSQQNIRDIVPEDLKKIDYLLLVYEISFVDDDIIKKDLQHYGFDQIKNKALVVATPLRGSYESPVTSAGYSLFNKRVYFLYYDNEGQWAGLDKFNKLLLQRLVQQYKAESSFEESALQRDIKAFYEKLKKDHKDWAEEFLSLINRAQGH